MNFLKLEKKKCKQTGIVTMNEEKKKKIQNDGMAFNQTL
jgi:hypothetical protein